MDMLKILETNRNLRSNLEIAKEEYKTGCKEIKATPGYSSFVKREKCAELLIEYGRKIDTIKAQESNGNIIVNYNGKILYDLATLKICDRRRIYAKDENIKEGFYIIERKINEEDTERFCETVSQELFYLREIAYLYFKNYRKTSSKEFCLFANESFKNEGEMAFSKDLLQSILDSLLIYKSEDIINEDIKKVNNATKKYIIKKF